MKTTPTIAIMYDFDKTLCTKDMQEYTFIPQVGMEPTEFWARSNDLATTAKMDGILAYMYIMLETAGRAKKPIRRRDFVSHGGGLEFFPGVFDWFANINTHAKEIGVTVEHFIISSGLKEIIEGSPIVDQFKEIFACEFLYDENEVAVWPKNCVNYTTKTQFLFRINKGVLDISNDYDLNRYTPEDSRPIPFTRMIYIGDGYTDVPCMKLVKSGGGCSIAVYTKESLPRARDLLLEGRVNHISLADYNKDKELYEIVCDCISRMI